MMEKRTLVLRQYVNANANVPIPRTRNRLIDGVLSR